MTIVVIRNKVYLYQLLYRRAFLQWFICIQAYIGESCDSQPNTKLDNSQTVRLIPAPYCNRTDRVEFILEERGYIKLIK